MPRSSAGRNDRGFRTRLGPGREICAPGFPVSRSASRPRNGLLPKTPVQQRLAAPAGREATFAPAPPGRARHARHRKAGAECAKRACPSLNYSAAVRDGICADSAAWAGAGAAAGRGKAQGGLQARSHCLPAATAHCGNAPPPPPATGPGRCPGELRLASSRTNAPPRGTSLWRNARTASRRRERSTPWAAMRGADASPCRRAACI